MIVHNFNIMRSICLPFEADSKLVDDSNAMLPLPVILQGFQSVARRNPKIIQFGSSFDHVQLAESNCADRLPALIRPSFEEFLRVVVREALNHYVEHITRHVICKAYIPKWGASDRL
jgi:hypothetical protein